MSPADATAIASRARAMAGELTTLLALWCGIPSHAGDPAGQRRMAGEIARRFGAVGALVAREPVGPAGLEALSIRSPERAGPRVLLVGHYDTVPHEGGGPVPEVVVDGDRLRARGAADMKGGLVVMLAALRLAESLGGTPPAWEAVVVPDEELGTPWSRDVLVDAAERADAALVFEPALPDGSVVRARKGVGTLTISVEGRAAHAGRNPDDGHSAIAALAELVSRLEALTNRRAGTVVTVTTIAGGSAPNVVPATAHAQLDIRVDHASESQRVLAGVQEIAGRAARDRGVEVVVDGAIHRPPKGVDVATRALFAAYRDHARALGIDLDWIDVGGGSDANLLAGVVPALDGLGVVGGGLHAADEYAHLPSLPERAACAALLLVGLTNQRSVT